MNLNSSAQPIGDLICRYLIYLSGWQHNGLIRGSACNAIKTVSSDMAEGICRARSEAHLPRFYLKGCWYHEIVGLILENGKYLHLEPY